MSTLFLYIYQGVEMLPIQPFQTHPIYLSPGTWECEEHLKQKGWCPSTPPLGWSMGSWSPPCRCHGHWPGEDLNLDSSFLTIKDHSKIRFGFLTIPSLRATKMEYSGTTASCMMAFLLKYLLDLQHLQYLQDLQDLQDLQHLQHFLKGRKENLSNCTLWSPPPGLAVTPYISRWPSRVPTNSWII